MHDIIVFGKGWYFERKREQIEKIGGASCRERVLVTV